MIRMSMKERKRGAKSERPGGKVKVIREGRRGSKGKLSFPSFRFRRIIN